MNYPKILQGKDIFIRTIELSDCTEQYVAWLNDPNVNRFLETRWTDQNHETICDFVSNILESDHSCLFAIVERCSQRHIGNIKIGPISPYYSCADVSYFIGDKSVWGKGYATQAIQLAAYYGFDQRGLHRLSAGVIAGNIASERALLKAGFTREGILREKIYTSNECADIILFGQLDFEYNYNDMCIESI